MKDTLDIPTADLPTVASLWVGGSLSWIEQTCLLSFVRLGQPVILYHYHGVSNVPPGVELRDAREIWTPPQTLFDHTAPSYIADLFRIHLMRHSDHIWVDTDIVALKPLAPDPDGYLVGWTPWQAEVNNCILRLPRGSETLNRWIEVMEDVSIVPPWLRPALRQRIEALPAAEREVGRFTASRTVMGPVALTALLKETGEVSHAQPADVLSPVPWQYVDVLFNPHGGWEGWITDDSRAVHLWSNVLSHHKKLTPPPTGFVGQMISALDTPGAMESGGQDWSAQPEAYRPLATEAEARGGLFIETAHHVIVYLPSETPKRLLVSFDDVDPARLSPPHDPNGLAIANAEGWSFLGILPKRKDWFQCDHLAAAMEQVRVNGLFDAYPAISFMGHGSAGFGACRFAALAPHSTLLTIAPTAPPNHDAADALTGAASASACLVLHDPTAPAQDTMVTALAQQGAMMLPARHFGADPRTVIQRSDMTRDVLTAALLGTLSQADFLSLLRTKRRHSGAYLGRLFTMALERGHLRLGLAAAEKSALSFDNWKTRKARQALKEALDTRS